MPYIKVQPAFAVCAGLSPKMGNYDCARTSMYVEEFPAHFVGGAAPRQLSMIGSRTHLLFHGGFYRIAMAHTWAAVFLRDRALGFDNPPVLSLSQPRGLR